MDQPVADGVGQRGISNVVMPFFERALAGEDGGPGAVAIFNNFQPPSTFSLLNSIGRGGDYAYRQPTIAKRIVVPSAASAKNLMPYYLKGANA